MNEEKPVEKPKNLFLTKNPTPSLHIVVDPLDALDKFLTLEMLFRGKCAITQTDCTITFTGTIDNLLHVLTQSTKVLSPHFLHLDPYEKAEVEAELNGLQSKKTPQFFSLSAKLFGKNDGTKKKSSSAERRRSSSMSVAEPRRSSAPSPRDMDTIAHPHNTSPATPPKKK